MSSAQTLNAFLKQFLEDRWSGRRRTLDEYVEIFPGNDAAIAEHFARFENDPPDDAGESSAVVVERIGRYRIVEELGRGGQGIVYFAEDERLKRPVALKVLTGLGALAPSRVARFLREAEVASKLDHPGIATVFEIGTDGHVPFIAMRFVEGETLAARIARAAGDGSHATLAVGDAVRIAEKAARALHAAHEAGIIHRDVKPGNILIQADGDPVIVDFGLAHDADAELADLTRTGEFFGTPAYMSPEQLASQGSKPDRRTDLWSLGATLYEALTLRRPFEAPTREQLYRAVLEREPHDPRRFNAVIPGDLAAIVEMALQKEVDRRYESGAAMADDLAAFAAGRPVAARRVGPMGRLRRWSRREPAKASLLVFALVALPLIAVLATSHYANRDRVESARLAKLAADKDEMLSTGFYESGEGHPDLAIASFERALSLEGGSPEAVLGIALANVLGSRARAAIEVLDANRHLVGGLRAAAKLRVVAYRKLGRESDALSGEKLLGACTSPVDFYLEGEELNAQGLAGREAAWAEALGNFRQAIFQSTAPRALYFEGMARAAQHAGDRGASREVASALLTHWPHSARCAFLAGSALLIVSPDESITVLREALRMDPNDAHAYANLGLAQASKRLIDDSVISYRSALRISPELPAALQGLAYGLQQQKLLGESILAYRHAIRVTPGSPELHYNFGNVLRESGALDEAIDVYREAVRLRPDYAEAQCNLGKTLVMTGRFETGLEAVRKGHEAGSRRPGWSFPSAKWVAEIEDLVRAERHMLAVAGGDEKPGDPTELLQLADLASKTRRWRLAAKWYESALDSDPALTRGSEHWGFKAAEAAIQASADDGSTSRQSAASGDARLRNRALSWLQSELAQYRDILETTSEAEAELLRKSLARWSADPLLAPIRDEARLAGLPPEERSAWTAFWGAVQAEISAR